MAAGGPRQQAEARGRAASARSAGAGGAVSCSRLGLGKPCMTDAVSAVGLRTAADATRAEQYMDRASASCMFWHGLPPLPGDCATSAEEVSLAFPLGTRSGFSFISIYLSIYRLYTVLLSIYYFYMFIRIQIPLSTNAS